MAILPDDIAEVIKASDLPHTVLAKVLGVRLAEVRQVRHGTECSVDGCGRPVKTRSYCNMHWLRVSKYGTPEGGPRNHAPPIERFWRFVEKGGPDDCWPFNCGSKDGSGHGRFQAGGKGSSGVQAHRWLYQFENGPIEPGLVVRHKCDNPRCVNLAHLELGTYKDNTADMDARGRRVTVAPVGEGNGKSVLTAEIVREIKASPLSHAALARKFGVSPNAVRGVRTGRTWTHVT